VTRAPLPAEIDLARSLWDADWAGGQVIESGDDHLVLIPGSGVPCDAVLRIARRPDVAAALPARMQLLQRLAPHLPFALSLPLTPVMRADPDAAGGWRPAAVVQRYVPGAAHPPHTGEPAELRRLLAALAAVPTEAYAGLVQAPFAREPRWRDEDRDLVLGVLPPENRDAATAVWDGLEAIDGEAVGLVHGDLAGENVRWHHGAVVGVLDWDHAAAWDPAINLAQLSLWHGPEIIGPAAPDPRSADRARLWVGHLALHRVRQAALTDAAAPGTVRRWTRLLRKAHPRVEAAAQAAQRLR